MLKDNGLVIGLVVTFLLIIGGVFFFSKDNQSGPVTPVKINNEILVSQSAYKTSGSVNGAYLPATESAKLTLVEFGDYQCPACALYHPLIKQLLQDFAGKINYVFRNFPLKQHANAQIASYAVEAAGLQGKYWEMHDKIYETQAEWSDFSDPKDVFRNYASAFGINLDQFNKDLDSPTIKDKINSDLNDGALVKLTATPTYYLNGVKIENMPPTYEDLKKLIEVELTK